jgi:hypothetical protein
MGNLKLKVADTDSALRFYFAVDVTPDMIASQLSIDAPSRIMAGDALKVRVTAGGVGVGNTSLSLDTDIGTTDINGQINYTIPKTLKAGTYTITASKTGYDQATKSIQIDKYVDYRLSIDIPTNADQYQNITIKVLYNGTAMSGAAVMFDNTSIGTTDSKGEVSYRLETSGTHSITASKTSYIAVSSDIDIRAPYSEFKALDINIIPGLVFTNEESVIRSNITNAGTKKDTLPVELIINETSVDNRSVTLAPGEIKEVNFTRKEAKAGNYTVRILGQEGLLEVKERPFIWNLILIVAMVTGMGIIVIYLMTAKNKISLEEIRRKFRLRPRTRSL